MIIAVQGWNDSEIDKIIDDFLKMYQNEDPYLEIEPDIQSENHYQLKFPIGIHPQIFIYPIN
jgi:hypothetical protein